MDYRQELSINTNIEQRQVMTPIMQQALKILQASTLKLMQLINQELEENPALEEEKPSSINESLDQKLEEAEKILKRTERNDDRTYNPNQEELTGKYDYMMNSVTYMETLQQHLEWQIRLVLSDDLQLKIAEYIIYNIDENGFLQSTISEIANYFNVERIEVKKVLNDIYDLEPVGVGVRDVREALLIQLAHNGLSDSWAYKIVESYYDDFLKNKLTKIMRAICITLDAVKEAKDVISTLNPYPGRAYNPKEIKYVIPDAAVDKFDEDIIVTVNDSIIPSLRISPSIQRLLYGSTSISKSDIKYITEKIYAARYIIKSITERKETLYKVVKSIFEVQKDFIDRGVKYLKPLTLIEIARMVKHHESTISRITSDKYVQTPRGIFKLKYFFSSKITGINRDDLASKSIKEMIKEVISKEDKTSPLTDSAIKDELEKLGYKISRRTVTKFRERVNILPSYKRKKW